MEQEEPAKSEAADASESTTRGRPARLARELLRFARSLRGRIVLLVLFATGITALLAAWTSATTIERYLDARIEQRFPVLLSTKARELDVWYQQARLNLATFTRSETLTRNLGAASADLDAATREELRNYLRIVQGQFERYLALYLLAADGSEIVRLGDAAEAALPEPVRKSASALTAPRVFGLTRVAGERAQIVGAPVPGSAGASLHAAISLDSLDRTLGEGIEGPATEVYLVDRNGSYVAGTLAAAAAGFEWQGPRPDGGVDVQTWVNGRGERVVGGVRTLEEFGWILAIEQDHAVAYAPVTALIERVLLADGLIGLVLIAFAVRLAVSATRPVAALSRAARAVAAGEDNVRVDDRRGAPELRELIRTFNQMTHNLELQREELERLSLTDGLTGSYNRRYFEDRLPVEIKRADRLGLPLALIVLDIDDFKKINDTWGHAVGDRVLQAVVAALADDLRATDLLARYGGEEFVILNLQEEVEGARALAEKLRRAVAALEVPLPESDDPSRQALRVTVSIGVAIHAGGAQELFRAADEALYEAKRTGKNRVVVA